MAKMLWKPSEATVKQTNIYGFMNFINERHGQNFAEFEPLYQWSIENITDFWADFWEFADIKVSKPYDQVIDDVNKMPGARWFSSARLNFAENLLRYRDDQVALIFKGEARDAIYITYAQLYDEVARLAASLKATGVVPGDRVVGFWPCWRPPAWGPPGRPVRLISASKACWIASVRFSPRFCLPPTGIRSRAKRLIR
jgi:acetoacetyl-CoA synthetase